MRKPPHDLNESLDAVSRLRFQLAPIIAMLPPTEAKRMIEKLHTEVDPLIDEARSAYVDAIDACESQERDAAAMRAKAKQQLDESKAKLANMPPVDEVKKGFVPPPVSLPVGVSGIFASEMRQRYAPPGAAFPKPEQPGAAWQDWTLS